uniref:Uncharacterized protein n=3 Tax=Meloidogyne TaxID=189290 RepID=A0A915ND92_9BILA
MLKRLFPTNYIAISNAILFNSHLGLGAAERAAMEAEFERQSEEARFRMAHGYDQSGESVNAKDEEGKEMAGEAFEETHNHKEPLAH